MNAEEKASLSHLKVIETMPAGAIIVDMGEGKEQRAFLYADVTSIGSQPNSRKPSFSVQLARPSVILRMNSQSDMAQKLAQLTKAEHHHVSL